MSYDIKNFQTDVIEQSRTIPVVADFWAEWCAPCKLLGPVLEKLAAKSAGVWELKKVNTEIFRDEAAAYNVRSIPNVKLFIGGEQVDEFVGALPENAVEQWLKKVLPDPYAGKLTVAKALLDGFEYLRAQQLLSSILEQSPSHAEATLLYVMSIFFEDRTRALQLLEKLSDDPAYWERIDAIRTLDATLAILSSTPLLPDAPVREQYITAIRALADHQFDAALAGFIDVIRKDRFYDKDNSRKTCIAIFKFLGEGHEITLRHRKVFDRAF